MCPLTWGSSALACCASCSRIRPLAGHSPEPEGTPATPRTGGGGGGGRARTGGASGTPRNGGAVAPEPQSIWVDKKRALQERLKRINAQLKKLGMGGSAAQPTWVAPPVTPRNPNPPPLGALSVGGSPWYAAPLALPGSAGMKRKGVDSPSTLPAVKRPRKKGVERLAPTGKLKNLYAHCDMLLDSIMKDKIARMFFNVPVDPVALNLPDYLQKIKRPMDLGSIKTRLGNEYYTTAEEFQADINLVWENAMFYNPPGTEAHEGARALQDSTDKRFKKLPKVPGAKDWGELDSGMATPGGAAEQRRMADMMRKMENMQRDLETLTQKSQKPAGGSQKKKASASSTKMSFEEKKNLSLNINKLPVEAMPKVLEIIKRRRSHVVGQDEDEVEIDIDLLDNATLRELDKFVQSRLKPKQAKPSQNAALQAAAQAAVGGVGAAGRGNSSDSDSDSDESIGGI